MAPAALVEASMVTVGTKNLVWVRIRTFLAGTQGAVEAAIDAHRQDSSARIGGWILDLRGNPGGVVDEAVGVADLFYQNTDQHNPYKGIDLQNIAQGFLNL